MKFIRILLVGVMAFTMVAWVAGEDVRESDAAFNRCEMLQGAKFQAPSQRVLPVVRSSSFSTQYRIESPASAEVSATHLTLMSNCILRC
jgi:hypothetical protein